MIPTAPTVAVHETRHTGQVRIAYRLAGTHSGQLLHVHGLGWHAWDGQRWTEDRQGATKRAVLDVLRTSFAESFELPDDAGKALRRDIRACESGPGIRGVLDVAAALEPFAATIADLDPDPYLLNTPAGTLDLRTGALRDHNPADRITVITRGCYTRTAHQDGTEWGPFLARVLPEPEVRAFLQRVAGLALLGRVVEHVLPILTGKGANGKSVWYGAVGYSLGDYAMTAESDLFMHRDGAHPTGEMDLRGRRWVVVSESDKDRRLAEATVKRLTGGDMIRARRMRQDFVEFVPSHTPVLVTNHLPKVRSDDPAIWRRLRVVPFNVVIPEPEQDKYLAERLELEADDVLAWAIEGYRDYLARGGLDEPAAVDARTREYQMESDAVARFIKDCCIVNPHMWVTTTDAYTRWQAWATRDGADHMSQRALGRALDEAGYPTTKGTGGKRIRRGIGLATEEEG